MKAHTGGLFTFLFCSFSSALFTLLLTLNIVEHLHYRFHHHEIDEVVINVTNGAKLIHPSG
ncbi:hypothetical protein ACX2ZQ_003838 [Klebsiella pneumoniae]